MVSQSIQPIKAILLPILLVTFLVAAFSCIEEESAIPTNLPPRVALDEAYNINSPSAKNRSTYHADRVYILRQGKCF